MRSTRKRALSTDLVEGWFQQKLDKMKQNLSERMVSSELEKTATSENINLLNERLKHVELEVGKCDISKTQIVTKPK